MGINEGGSESCNFKYSDDNVDRDRTVVILIQKKVYGKAAHVESAIDQLSVQLKAMWSIPEKDRLPIFAIELEKGDSIDTVIDMIHTNRLASIEESREGERWEEEGRIVPGSIVNDGTF